MNSKQYLMQLKRLDDMISAKHEQLLELRTIATKTTGSSDERVQSSSISDQVSENAVKIADLEVEINQHIYDLLVLKKEIMDCISKVENYDYKLLLSLRYINYKTWEEIAHTMKFSPQWIHEIHRRALKEIKKS